MSILASLGIAIGLLLLTIGMTIFLNKFNDWGDDHPALYVIFGTLMVVLPITATIWVATN